MRPVRVLFVGGTGRSGSTIVANVLGELPGCVSVGELRYVWERGLLEDRLCGCGLHFAECPFWGEVLQTAFGEHRPDAVLMAAVQHRWTRLRALPRLVALRRRPERLHVDMGELPEALVALYRAVALVSGAEVVVDSSKLPTYALLLDTLPELDVAFVHLLRDPRASAYSWRRRKRQPDGRPDGFMERRSVGKSVGLWLIWNAVIEWMWRPSGSSYTRLTYEQFVSRPRAVVDELAHELDLRPAGDGLFLDDTTVRLGTSHTVAGNPARLRSGEVALSLDDEWRSAMSARDRLLVTAGAAPLMSRYGYPWQSRDAPP